MDTKPDGKAKAKVAKALGLQPDDEDNWPE
jgi:hypothetical protein